VAHRPADWLRTFHGAVACLSGSIAWWADTSVSEPDRGRPEDTARNAGVAGMLRSGMSWTAIQEATGCSRATIAEVRVRAA
jgi:hypothetical protein